MAREPAGGKINRIGVTLTGRRGPEGDVVPVPGSRRKIAPERIVCVMQGDEGTVLRQAGGASDMALGEDLDAIVAQSGGVLIKLTPLSFEDVIEGENHADRGQFIAVNIDHLTILPTRDKRGTIIRVDTAPRNIVVAETVAEIEALIDG